MKSTYTKEEITYYKKDSDNVVVTAGDFERIDSDRLDYIGNLATQTVAKKEQKLKASNFKNNSEYKFYLLSIYSAITMAERSLL